MPHVFDRVSPDYRNLGAQLRFRPGLTERKNLEAENYEGLRSRSRTLIVPAVTTFA